MKKQLLHSLVLAAITLRVAAQASWVQQNSGLLTTGTGIDKIAIVDANTAWCASNYYTATHEFSRTTDGGNTWTPGPITAVGLNHALVSLAAIDANTAYVLAYGTANTNALFKTIDGGATWTQSGAGVLFTNSSSYPDAVYFWNAAHGFVIGDPVNNKNEVFITSDSGSTWVQTPVANMPVNTVGTFSPPNPLVVLDSTMWFCNTNGRILKSTDAGLNWTITIINATKVVYNIAFLDDKLNGLALMTDNTTFKTTDGGATWAEVFPSGITPSYLLTTIPGTNYFVSGNNAGSPSCLISSDMGDTWIPIDSTSGHGFWCLTFLDINTGYGGDAPFYGGILKFNRGSLGLNSIDVTQKFSVFPNPVTDQLMIQGVKKETSVQLMTTEGKILIERILRTNSVLDFSSFSQGLYFLKTGNEVRKIVKK